MLVFFLAGWYNKKYQKEHTKQRRHTTMTDKQLKQAESQLPQGERFDRAYSAFEGGIRLISKRADGTETRYQVHFEADNNVRIERI